MMQCYRERSAWITAEEALSHIARWVAEHPKPQMLHRHWNARNTGYWKRRIALRELVWAQSDGKVRMLGVGSTLEAEEVPPLFHCRHWQFDQRQDPRDLTHYPELWVSRVDVEREWPLDPPRIIDLEAQEHIVPLLAAPGLGESTTSRRRGRKPDKRETIKAKIREMGLDEVKGMKEIAWEAMFGASRDTCRKAVKELESEIVGKCNSRQIATIGK
jgi:hypothetical protein